MEEREQKVDVEPKISPVQQEVMDLAVNRVGEDEKDDLRNSLTEIFEAISDNDTLNAKGEGKSSLSRLFNKEEGYEEERARILAVKAEYFSVDKESFGPTEKGAKVLAAISEVRKNDIGNMSMMLRRDDRETYDKNVSRSLALAQAENFISKGLRI